MSQSHFFEEVVDALQVTLFFVTIIFAVSLKFPIHIAVLIL